MDAILVTQRAAFMAELPVSLDTRRDRLDRAVRMLTEGAMR